MASAVAHQLEGAHDVSAMNGAEVENLAGGGDDSALRLVAGAASSGLKRNQIKADLAQARKFAETDASWNAALQSKLQRRKDQLKTEREKGGVCYKPKVAAALRDTSWRDRVELAAENGSASAVAALNATAGSHASNKQARDNTVSPARRPSPPRKDAEDEPRFGDTSRALRERLKMTFAQTTASHAYGTLFPPLLTPYNRVLNIKFPDRSGTAHGDKPPDVFPQPPQSGVPEPSNREPFSRAGRTPARPQPGSGPKAFLPTGSATSAYRVLTNFNYVAREAQQAQTKAAVNEEQSMGIQGARKAHSTRAPSTAPERPAPPAGATAARAQRPKKKERASEEAPVTVTAPEAAPAQDSPPPPQAQDAPDPAAEPGAEQQP